MMNVNMALVSPPEETPSLPANQIVCFVNEA